MDHSGQGLCTAAAVLGGKSLASQISEKMVINLLISVFSNPQRFFLSDERRLVSLPILCLVRNWCLINLTAGCTLQWRTFLNIWPPVLPIWCRKLMKFEKRIRYIRLLQAYVIYPSSLISQTPYLTLPHLKSISLLLAISEAGWTVSRIFSLTIDAHDLTSEISTGSWKIPSKEPKLMQGCFYCTSKLSSERTIDDSFCRHCWVTYPKKIIFIIDEYEKHRTK